MNRTDSTLHYDVSANEMFPLAFSARSLVICYWFLILTWHACWQATMTAFFSQNNLALPVHSIKELANQKSVRPVILDGTSNYNFFKVNTVSMGFGHFCMMKCNSVQLSQSVNRSSYFIHLFIRSFFLAHEFTRPNIS